MLKKYIPPQQQQQHQQQQQQQLGPLLDLTAIAAGKKGRTVGGSEERGIQKGRKGGKAGKTKAEKKDFQLSIIKT